MSTSKKGFEGTRTPRASTTREKAQKRKPWAPASSLDAPPAPEGYKHRWVRAEARGFVDTKNVSARLREGYELVRADEYPNFEAPVVDSGKYEGVIGVGGLLLARIPLETVAERNAYYNKRSKDLQEAVDQELQGQNAHSSMRISNPDRQTRVNFGGPLKE
jgi:hypothetical protein|tara:strand:+ start:154 stop:636 length:483 start_codon:yes stop_codon:yes gene_type:complete